LMREAAAAVLEGEEQLALLFFVGYIKEGEEEERAGHARGTQRRNTHTYARLEKTR
jgi:hypothetical protein